MIFGNDVYSSIPAEMPINSGQQRRIIRPFELIQARLELSVSGLLSQQLFGLVKLTAPEEVQLVAGGLIFRQIDCAEC
jgi:hypothetical protein